MRLADKPRAEATETVAVTPEVVWAEVTDLAFIVACSDELQEAHWINGADGPALGAQFLGRNWREDIGTWETTSTVVECEHATSFAWAVGDDPENPAATWRFTIAARPDARGGAVDLTQSVCIGSGPSYLTARVERDPAREEEFVDYRLETLRRAMVQTVEGVRERLESTPRD